MTKSIFSRICAAITESLANNRQAFPSIGANTFWNWKLSDANLASISTPPWGIICQLPEKTWHKRPHVVQFKPRSLIWQSANAAWVSSNFKRIKFLPLPVNNYWNFSRQDDKVQSSPARQLSVLWRPGQFSGALFWSLSCTLAIRHDMKILTFQRLNVNPNTRMSVRQDTDLNMESSSTASLSSSGTVIGSRGG